VYPNRVPIYPHISKHKSQAPSIPPLYPYPLNPTTLLLQITRRTTSGSTNLLLRLPPLFLRLPSTPEAALPLNPLLKAQRRMKQIQHQHRHDHHDALKRNKQVLTSNQIPRPPLRQLRHAVHAAPEDANRGERQGAQEPLELPVRAQRHEVRVLVKGGRAEGLGAPVRVDREIDGEQHEDEERGYLEGEARDHDVVPQRRVLVGVGAGGGDAAAGGLEEEGDDIAGDELRTISTFPSYFRIGTLMGEKRGRGLQSAYTSPA